MSVDELIEFLHRNTRRPGHDHGWLAVPGIYSRHPYFSFFYERGNYHVHH